MDLCIGIDLLVVLPEVNMLYEDALLLSSTGGWMSVAGWCLVAWGVHSLYKWCRGRVFAWVPKKPVTKAEL